MSVDEFMINYIFATRRERNQGFQDKYHKWLMHGSRYTQLKHHCCTMKTITHTCDKSRKTLTTKHREEEEGTTRPSSPTLTTPCVLMKFCTKP
jgi:hypothetical protein